MAKKNLKNPRSGLVIFLVVSFNMIPLFSEDLILNYFLISFTLLFVRITP